MQDPKIITTKAIRGESVAASSRGPGAAGRYAEVGPGGPHSQGTSPRASANRPRRSFFAHRAFYGLLLIGAGSFVWSILTDDRPSVPVAWQEPTGASGASTQLDASVRSAGPGQGELLRFEWPAHPKAESYIVRFEGPDGFETSPIPVLGSVFLYDLKSDVFSLPSSFRWSVTAVMADGTQVSSGVARFER